MHRRAHVDDRDCAVGTRGPAEAARPPRLWLCPADLQAILTGCVVPMPQAIDARQHANGWASIDLLGGATLYLEPVRKSAAVGRTLSGSPNPGAPNSGSPHWQLRAARRAGWQIEYQAWSN